MDDQGNRKWEHRDQYGIKLLLRQYIPSAEQTCEVDQFHYKRGNNDNRIPWSEAKQVILCHIIENGCELCNDQQDKIYSECDKFGIKKSAFFPAFTAAAKQKQCHHLQRYCGYQGHQKIRNSRQFFQSRDPVENHFHERKAEIQKKKSKESHEETLTPSINTRHDDSKTKSHTHQQECCTEKDPIDKNHLFAHLPKSPGKNGYRNLLSCSLTPSGVNGLRINPQAPVLQASKA